MNKVGKVNDKYEKVKSPFRDLGFNKKEAVFTFETASFWKVYIENFNLSASFDYRLNSDQSIYCMDQFLLQQVFDLQ